MQNQPGVLAHVSGMFASRGFNIDSLAVGETEDPHLSRITVVVMGDDRHLEQVRKQLEKIVTVVKVHDISREDYVERDLMLIKVNAPPGAAAEIQALVQIFRGRIVDVSPEQLMIEISGPGEEDRGVHRAGPPLRHPRAGPDRPDRPGPRRPPARGRRDDVPTGALPTAAARAADRPRAFRALIRARSSRLADLRRAGSSLPRAVSTARLRACRREDTPMPAKMYYDQDADLCAAQGQDDRDDRLRQPGARPGAEPARLGLRRGGRPAAGLGELRRWRSSDGFKPVSAAEAAEAGDLVNILLPDEVQGDIYTRDIKPHLRPGNLLLCSHGFNIHFGQVVPPEGVDCALVAPKGPGHLVRSEFVKGGGVPCLIATAETCTPGRQGPGPGLRQGDRRHPRRASSRRRSPRRPRPTSSASRSCSAAASAPW